MVEKLESAASGGQVSEIADRYQRAEGYLQKLHDDSMVKNATIHPVWIDKSDCFWYLRKTVRGKQYRLVDASQLTNDEAFDHLALAKTLEMLSSEKVNADDLPIKSLSITLEPKVIEFEAFDRAFRYAADSGECDEVHKGGAVRGVVSPDGRYSVFVKDHNLWLHNTESQVDKPLTHDGESQFSYGANGTGWGFPMTTRPQALWSPDSQKIFTVIRDVRRVEQLPIVQYVPGDGSLKPKVDFVSVAHPGDVDVEEVRLLVIDIVTERHQLVNYSQLPVTRNGFGFFDARMGWWSKNSQKAWFVHVDRYYKWVRLVEFNTNNGATKIVFEESTNTHINLMLNQDERPTFLPLTDTDELLWFSERTGWGHLYLYDLNGGEKKNSVTSGDWLVRDLVYYDAREREVYVQAAGRIENRDPYYRDLLRVDIDTGSITTLACSDHEYVCIPNKANMMLESMRMFAKGYPVESCGISPTGNYGVVTRSRVDQVPRSILINREGQEILVLEDADVSGLPAGWQWPEPVEVIAADGKTKIYGAIYRPSGFSPDKSYPVIAHGFNQPEISWVPKGSFTNDKASGLAYVDAIALAELGFIVVQLDGRGSPMREKSFFDESYGWFELASHIDDHAAGIKQLVQRYPYMDIDRVGISAMFGGSGAIQGLLKHPDLFKVATTAMYHDRRFMPASMQGDKYEGAEPHVDEFGYPEDYIGNLQGKLLLIGGMLDITTPISASFRLVEALRKANKDFDMIFLPNHGHGIDSYLIRRGWDYFVRHLMQSDPPHEYSLKTIFG